jgi:hypothetical protein
MEHIDHLACQGERHGRSPIQPSSTNVGRAPETVDVTTRLEIASFSSYAEAEAAVDALADEQFPVERLAIVAEGLRYVEDVTGRRALPEAILQGLLTGAVLGAFLGFFFGLFDWVEPLMTGLALAFYGAIFGAVGGGLLGGLAHWLSEGRRNFSSVAGMQAERYVVVTDAELADEGARRLGAASRRR